MNTATLLLTFGFPVHGTNNNSFLLREFLFTKIISENESYNSKINTLYFKPAWKIALRGKTYQVCEVLASQIAYALTASADTDYIKESLMGYEVVDKATETPKEPEIPDAEYEERQRRKAVVKELVKKATERLTLVT